MNFGTFFKNRISFSSVDFVRNDSFHVGYGEGDLDLKTFERHQYAEVEAIYIHPKFERNIHHLKDIALGKKHHLNDIALLKLRQPLKFNETVQPACLPDHHEDHYDGPLQVTPVAGFKCLNFKFLNFGFHSDHRLWICDKTGYGYCRKITILESGQHLRWQRQSWLALALSKRDPNLLQSKILEPQCQNGLGRQR